MNEKKQEIDDIDGPLEIDGRMHALSSRVGVSKKGLAIGSIAGVALLGAVLIGISNAGPGSKQTEEKAKSSSDMPGQNQAYNVAKDIKVREPEQEGGPLQVRDEPVAVASATNTGPQQKSPQEQFEFWREKHKYERIQGAILASDAAYTSELTKTSGASMGGIRPASMQDDPMARIAGARNGNLSALAGLTGAGASPATPAAAPVSSMPPMLAAAAGADTNVAQQLRNREFLREAAEAGYLPERVKQKMGQHELAAGSIIPAVMLTGINSDLPGVITAQVRQSIYDTFDENVLVIPQGSRLVGRYSSQVAYGQDRALVAWDELIMPNGQRMNLRGMSGADGIGQAGFSDQVDNHFVRIWGSAFLVSMLGVGVQLSQPQNASVNTSPTTAQQASSAAANSLNQAGGKVLDKNQGLSPTIMIRPGYTFNVIVNKSLVLPAYRG